MTVWDELIGQDETVGTLQAAARAAVELAAAVLSLPGRPRH